MRAIANSGPLIHLSWIGRLDTLRVLFTAVVVPAAVREEVLRADPSVPGAEAIRAALAAGWLGSAAVAGQAPLPTLLSRLDRGEAEAIALREEIGDGLLLLDERRARAEAARRSLPFTGTIGLLQQAQARGILRSVPPILEELRRLGFWISPDLIEQVRRAELGQ